MACKGEWKESKLYEKMISRKSVRNRGARVWLTRHQITQKYGDPQLADEIIKAKESDAELRESQTRPHPDNPAIEAWVF